MKSHAAPLDEHSATGSPRPPWTPRWVLWAFLPLLWACGGAVEDAPRPTDEPPPPAAVEMRGAETDAQRLQHTALLLAGMRVEDGPRKDLWQSHRDAMDALWATIEERHLHAMRDWAVDALAEAQGSPQAVFYPFGGPDLPSVHQFFPDAPSYVLVGLEPPGTLPDLDAFTDEVLAAELERLREGLSNLAEKGYFVARHMVQDFGDAQRLEGFVPVLYIFLARAGYEPLSVRFVELSDDGELTYRERLTTNEVYGFEMVFQASGAAADEAPRRLYYFAQDLSDEGLAAVPGFAPFVRHLGAFDVYMKSAMYLPHEPTFGELERLMFEGRSVLQDDSGVPWSHFDPALWDSRLFGVYTQTLSNYRQYFQPDLVAAYAESGESGTLPFAIGYNSRVSGSCLIWARRKGTS